MAGYEWFEHFDFGSFFGSIIAAALAVHVFNKGWKNQTKVDNADKHILAVINRISEYQSEILDIQSDFREYVDATRIKGALPGFTEYSMFHAKIKACKLKFIREIEIIYVPILEKVKDSYEGQGTSALNAVKTLNNLLDTVWSPLVKKLNNAAGGQDKSPLNADEYVGLAEVVSEVKKNLIAALRYP